MSAGAFFDWVNQTFFNMSPEQEELEHHQMMVEYGIEPMTPAEQFASDQEERSAYINMIASQGTMRSVSYSKDGYMYWEEYVIDRDGQKVVIHSGSHYVGGVEQIPSPDGNAASFGHWLGLKDGQFDEKLPVWKRLQG